MAANVVHRQKSDSNLKEIDKTAKNKFRWAWLERCVTLTLRDSSGKLTKSDFILGDFIRKVDKDGVALCVICDTYISYASRGASALEGHCLKQKHCLKVSIGKTNSTMDSFVDTKKPNETTESYGLHPLMSTTKKSDESTLRPLVPMCDRVSNSEGMVLAFVAEHSLSLSMTPAIVDLAKSLAHDRAALNSLTMGRHSASYKMNYGLAHTFREEMVRNLQDFPFSLNIDESTSSNHHRILAILVSYYVPNEAAVRVEHLASLDIIKVDSKSLYEAIDALFIDLGVPWSNLVSCLMDSCNVMRGSKNGVEIKMRQKAPQLLDIDGDSCHHVHNASKRFSSHFDKWVEQMLTDLHNDFKWSADLKEFLMEICDILNVQFTMPQRYVSHRWLSVYEVSLQLKMLWDCYYIFYFAFIPKNVQPEYEEVLAALMKKYSVRLKAREVISGIHKQLAQKWKTLTEDGKNRKNRILKRLVFQEKKTKMIMEFYISVLPLLQNYVKVFQSRETLIHKLHDRQCETFMQFLVAFVKPEKLVASPAKALKSIKLQDEDCLLNVKDMFVGHGVDKIVAESRRDDSTVIDFLKKAAAAYLDCATYLQQKLPLENRLLQALSSIDPMARGHSVTAKVMKQLATTHMTHFLSEEAMASIHREIMFFQVDTALPAYEEGSNIVKWWSDVHKKGNYPGLCRTVSVALSIFHGPQVESSFNLMGDVIDKKSSKLNVDTFCAIQTVKYALLSKKKTSIEYFHREEPKHSSVNRTLCRNLRNAANRRKQALKVKSEERNAKKERLGLSQQKKETKSQAKVRLQKAAEASRKLHHERAKKNARKQVLQQMADHVAKKRKIE